MVKNTTEQDQVANATVLEDDTNAVVQSDQVLTEEQFEALPEAVRELITDAEALEAEKIMLQVKIDANRTLLRAYRDMGKVSAAVVELYYTSSKRGQRLSPAEKAAKLRADADALEAAS